jgi:hypothetical protein
VTLCKVHTFCHVNFKLTTFFYKWDTQFWFECEGILRIDLHKGLQMCYWWLWNNYFVVIHRNLGLTLLQIQGDICRANWWGSYFRLYSSQIKIVLLCLYLFDWFIPFVLFVDFFSFERMLTINWLYIGDTCI